MTRSTGLDFAWDEVKLKIPSGIVIFWLDPLATALAELRVLAESVAIIRDTHEQPRHVERRARKAKVSKLCRNRARRDGNRQQRWEDHLCQRANGEDVWLPAQRSTRSESGDVAAGEISGQTPQPP